MDNTELYLKIFATILQIALFCVAVVKLYAINTTLKQNTHATLYSQCANVVNVFIERPELRAYFYEGKKLTEAKDIAEEIRKRSVAELICDSFVHNLLAASNVSKEAKNSWENYMVMMHTMSPAIQEHLVKYGSWYSPIVHNVIKNQITSTKRR